MNRWIEHIKRYANKKGIKYGEALKSAECKALYKRESDGEGLSSSKQSRRSNPRVGIADENFTDVFAQEYSNDGLGNGNNQVATETQVRQTNIRNNNASRSKQYKNRSKYGTD